MHGFAWFGERKNELNLQRQALLDVKGETQETQKWSNAKRRKRRNDENLQRQAPSSQKPVPNRVIFIEQNQESILKKFRGSHARAVRKAEKIGVEVRKTNQVEEFYTILKENLKIRHGVEPTHTLEEIYKLIKLFPKSINVFGAFYKGEMIAGALNFLVKGDVALAFYISHKEEFQDMRPLNLLFYKIFKWALNENIEVYDFGIFTVDGEPNMGLGRFKENFGASGIFRDTFQITL